ncbi:hypothetical protein EW145_g6558, partial [Phellinidium pouzarii]
MVNTVLSGLSALIASAPAFTIARAVDPCAAIGGKKWVAPSAVRACFDSFPINESTKSNILDVVTKSLAFHTSVSYQVRAPKPFTADVHEDILGDLARIGSTAYSSEFAMHVDLSLSVKRLMDGHCVYSNLCYDSLFLTFVPVPLVLLTDAQGDQAVHIAPEAFEVTTAEFADEIEVWQDALPGNLKGQLASLSGAKVLAINGQDPFVAVDANAAITGSFEGFGTRQNSFFSSYQRVDAGWNYIMGNFAQMSLPLADFVDLTVQRVNSSATDTFSLPYRSRFGTSSFNFTDSASFRANNCVATASTNGVDANANADPVISGASAMERRRIGRSSSRQVSSSPRVGKNAISAMFIDRPLKDVVLPPPLQPASPIAGTGVTQFYMLEDGKTGVLSLGSFEEPELDPFMTTLLSGLRTLVSSGATQLIVDVTNNGGGFICAAHWLHRIIAGPKNTTVPQAGLFTKARAGPLAQLIVQQISDGADPNNELMYNPLNWRFANNTPFPAEFDWLQPPVKTVINGRSDSFSQRLGQECQPFDQTPPDAPLFDTKKVVIVSNGRCASSCSLFSVTMSKEEGAKTVVVGGKKDVTQQYCGTVGGESSDFTTMDTEVKVCIDGYSSRTTHLKNNSLAPPDFLTNSAQGITWRLGFGIEDTQEPE